MTLGKPAALERPPGSARLEAKLAALTGCEHALLAPSTLHLFFDLFSMFAKAEVNIVVDGGAYPIARWGIHGAAHARTSVINFRQHDLRALQKALDGADGKPPVIVTDGYSVEKGSLAPIADYLAVASARGGFVVVDDSQALGIFGKPSRSSLYGIGGGGSARHLSLRSDRLIVGCSLAKAFGVPVAVIAGSIAVLKDFERHSATRVHCSPPSIAVIAAGLHAMAINRRDGDALRQMLAAKVSRFRRGLRELGLIATASLFPIQAIRLPTGRTAEVVHSKLQKRGIQTVLHSAGRGRRRWISFVISVLHSDAELDSALAHLENAIG